MLSPEPPPMTDSPTLSRDQLYQNWLSWSAANLGGNQAVIEAAANAAADTAAKGEGFNAAADAGKAAWYAAAQSDATAWRPDLTNLILTSAAFWVLIGLIVGAPLLAAIRGPWLLAVLLLPFALAAAIWQIGEDVLLSAHGAVAKGTLTNVISGTRGSTAFYGFTFEGRQYSASKSFYFDGSVRQDVLVLFWPAWPGAINKVLSELLNPGSQVA
jgi:hypothetical protein